MQDGRRTHLASKFDLAKLRSYESPSEPFESTTHGHLSSASDFLESYRATAKCQRQTNHHEFVIRFAIQTMFSILVFSPSRRYQIRTRNQAMRPTNKISHPCHERFGKDLGKFLPILGLQNLAKVQDVSKRCSM